MDEPSAQLHSELQATVTEALGSRRPILHHLNADTSWLLQIPRPTVASDRGGRYYFNILIDPWLAGGQSDVAKWFSQQFHATESSVPSISAVEKLIGDIEILATELRLAPRKGAGAYNATDDGRIDSLIDVVAISHEFTDHCHQETLLQVHPDVPVFATDKAASLIRGWGHFRQVLPTPRFGENLDWHATSVPPLPEWLGISRLVSQGDALYYHSAILIAFNNLPGTSNMMANQTGSNQSPAEGKPTRRGQSKRRTRSKSASDILGGDDSAEAVIYTPHGIHNESLATVSAATPPINTVAFLHGLHDISLGSQQQLNLGAHNGLKAQRLLNAKYWIGTHDEVKHGGGLVSWFLRRKIISIKDALDNERKSKTDGSQNINSDSHDRHADVLDSFAGTNWLELANGESRILV